MYCSAHRRIGDARPFGQVDFNSRQFGGPQRVDAHAKHLKSGGSDGLFGAGDAPQKAWRHLGADGDTACDAGSRWLAPNGDAQRFCCFANGNFAESRFGEWVANSPFGCRLESRAVFAEIIHDGAIGDPGKTKTSRFNGGDIEKLGLTVEAAVTRIFAVSRPFTFVRGDDEVPNTQSAGVLDRFSQFAIG